MKKDGKFNCVIVGGGSLPIRCAEILLSKNQEICAIVSSDADVKSWALEKKIAYLTPGANLSAQLSEHDFDYLFSIVNEHILREDVLSLPRQLAVNYHDAILPRYAGTHATSWALLNGETSHGITWHVITDVVDAGDVLKQERVEISADDTALTLNTKCYEAAIKTFAQLVDEFSTGTASLKKQNLDDRTFFPRFKRPVNGCVISWNSRAADISALVRALNFGNVPNPLGSAKLAVKNEFFVVNEVKISSEASKNPLCTISKIGQDFVQISTADFDVILRKISRLNGQSISIPNLTADFDLREGFQFAEPDAETAGRLETLYTTLCKHESFWVKKLSNVEPAVPPYANKTVSPDAAQYLKVPMRLPDEVFNLLKEQPDWKADEFLLASFGLLLGRLGEADCFDVGYKNSETQNEVAGLENFFATQVPLRISFDGLQSFAEFFKSIQEQSESLKKHKTYTKDLAVRYPQLRKTSESGEFPLPVAVEKTERLEDYKITTNGDLTLVISENEAECLWVYNGERITTENVEKLIGHFTTLLKGIAAKPDCQTAYLPVLTEKEKHQLLVEWNNTRADFSQDVCIHELIAARAKELPDAVAVVCGDKQLSYAELDERSNRLARYLKQSGVKAETLVAVFMERSIETVVGLLGILKAGGAYLPLDPAYPPERLAFMLEDAAVQVLLTQQRLKSSLPPNKCDVLCLDTDWNIVAQESEEPIESGATAKNLAYVIYTSGSTGKPKGVELEHGGLMNLVNWHWQTYNLTPADRATLLAGPAFDASVWELWVYLAVGASIHIPDEETRISAARLLAWLNEQKITVSFLPTPLAETLLELEMPQDLALRALLTGGDRLHPVKQESLPFKVINHYGPTENTVVTTFGVVEPDAEGKTAPTIGRPIANTEVYLLDRYLQPVPVGIAGELYIGGASLARGYLNRPDLTEERFITHSFGDGREVRLYKTGDSARYLPNGEIDFIDRIDSQVKIRGFRIELGEIEALLLSHPAVKEGAVIAREEQSGEKRLVAYFVQNQGLAVKASELRAYLKQKLPDYMIPAAFVELPELPLTPNGKVNRKALPAPAATISDTDREIVSHRDELELQIIKIWEPILGVQSISIKDDFFELGGHSLQAVRMFAEIEKIFGKNIPLATLFEASTVEKLAEILRQDGWSAPESSLVPIQPKGEKTPFFCVHAKGGNVLFYRDLAKYMGTERPFYGIQARRLGGRQVGHSSVEEMAEFYIKEIKTVQPEGPYYLGGSSFGGLAAFEIARQLRAQGDEVAFVALLDTGTPDYPKFLPTTGGLRSKFYTLVRRLQHHRDSLIKLNNKQRIEYVTVRLGKVKLKYRRKIRDNYKKLARKFYSARNQPVPKNLIQLEDHIWRAGQKYVPQVYEGDVTLFRATHQPLGIYPDPTLGWDGLVAGELEIHDVEGHHGSIVAEPYVRKLAEKMLDCLEQIESKEKQTVPKTKPVVQSQAVELSY